MPHHRERRGFLRDIVCSPKRLIVRTGQCFLERRRVVPPMFDLGAIGQQYLPSVGR